jgi:hypothetical protein
MRAVVIVNPLRAKTDVNVSRYLFRIAWRVMCLTFVADASKRFLVCQTYFVTIRLLIQMTNAFRKG